MFRSARLAVVAPLLLAATLSACSNSESQDQAESAVCTSLAQVRTAAAGVQALNASSTVDQVETATNALDAAIADLKNNAADLNQADLSALEASGDEIQKAAAGVSGDETLGEAAVTVKSSTAALDSTLTEMSNGVQCS